MGKAQVNLNNLNPESYGLDFPFIDCGKMMTSWQLFGSGVKTDIFSHLNSDGFPTGFPAGGTTWRSQTKGYLTASDPKSGNWILDWDGSATISANIGGGSGYPGIKATVVRSNSNSVRFNITPVNSSNVTFSGSCAPSGNNTVITVTGSRPGTVWTGQRISGVGIPADAVLGGQIGGTNGGDGTYAVNSFSNPFSTASTTVTLHAYELGEAFGAFIQVTAVAVAPTRIRFYRADQAALLNAGQITAPHFIAFYQKYGCLRFMDWQSTNGSITAQWINRPQKTNYSWLGSVLTAYCGICTQAAGTNDYTAPNTIAGNPSAWTDGMLVQAVFPTIPTTAKVTGMTNANPCKVTAPGHGFTTGQHVMFPSDGGLNSSGGKVSIANAVNWTNPTGALIQCAPDFTVTTIDANNFTLNGIDSTNWGTYISGGIVMAAIRVATSGLPLKRVVGVDCQNIYIESVNRFTQGTDFPGMGSPYSLVYNAAMDALLLTISPANENGQLLGVPIEVITQLCNECNVPPWICIPINATDDFFLQAATYLFNNLNSNLRARIELGNEIWNSQFSGRNFAQTMAGLQLGIVGSAGALNTDAYFQWQGWRHYNATAQIDTVYSGAMNRIYRVLATNGNATSTSQTALLFQAPNAGLGSGAYPYQRADALAVAPYIEPNRNLYPTAKAVYQFKIGNTTDAFAAADSWLNATAAGTGVSLYDWQKSFCPFWANTASKYGLEFHQYEGGWGVYPFGDQQPTSYDPGTGPVALSQADITAMWQGYKASPNWGNQYASVLATFKSNGGKFASNYWITSALWNFHNMFGAYGPNVFGVTKPYYETSQPTPEMVAFDAYNNS